MDCSKIGNLIKELRTESGMTQKQLADRLGISDKTVSKWERGLGCPDISLITELSAALNVNTEKILSGSLAVNSPVGGDMEKTKFFVCTVCGNISLCTGNASVSCCGRTLHALTPRQASENEMLTVSQVEDEWYIESSHPSTRSSYIPFIAFLKKDTLTVFKQYPEWSISARLPIHNHGMLVWYSTDCGLLCQKI